VVEYFPGGHTEHVVAISGEYVPGEQPTQLVEPVELECFPAAQLRHWYCDKAPVTAKYLPASHSVHEEAPVSGLYFLPSQAVQVFTVVAFVAPENLPGSHLLQIRERAPL